VGGDCVAPGAGRGAASAKKSQSGGALGKELARLPTSAPPRPRTAGPPELARNARRCRRYPVFGARRPAAQPGSRATARRAASGQRVPSTTPAARCPCACRPHASRLRLDAPSASRRLAAPQPPAGAARGRRREGGRRALSCCPAAAPRRAAPAPALQSLNGPRTPKAALVGGSRPRRARHSIATDVRRRRRRRRPSPPPADAQQGAHTRIRRLLARAAGLSQRQQAPRRRPATRRSAGRSHRGVRRGRPSARGRTPPCAARREAARAAP